MKSIRFIAVFFLCFMCFSFSGSYFEKNIDTNKVEIEIVYNNNKIFWSDDEILQKTKMFDFSGQAQKHFRLKDNVCRYELCNKLLKMGFSFDETMEYCFKGLTKKVDGLCKLIDKKPVDATLKFLPNSASCFLLTRESCGMQVDKAGLYKQIISELKTTNKIVIKLNPTVLKPNVYYSNLIKLTDLKSEFSTNFSKSSENRKHNIKKAISCFNGLILYPGQECSFNLTTKRRTKENGYRPANIIVNEEYVEGVGGGVCQVSTTLYNALLLCGAEILESHPHSLKSSYVMEGFDAMVNYGSSDLKFKNPYDYPLFFKTYCTDSDIYVKIYGKVENAYSIKRANKIVREIEPKKDKVIVDINGDYSDKVYYTDESFVKTQSKKGAEVYSYLETYDGQKLVNRKLIRKQTYKAVDGVVIKGAHKREETLEEKNTEFFAF